MKDKYDVAIEYLTEHPEEIENAWRDSDYDTPPEIAQAHCLFEQAGKHGHFYTPDHKVCGCLTQIRIKSNGYFAAWTPELTAEIQNDARIPSEGTGITVEHLEAFASWQRRLDKELNRA